MYARFLPPLLFSLKYMTCYVFTHEISDWNEYLHITFPQCVRTEPHSSRLRNVESSTCNFRQSVHKKKMMAVAKLFALHANAKKNNKRLIILILLKSKMYKKSFLTLNSAVMRNVSILPLISSNPEMSKKTRVDFLYIRYISILLLDETVNQLN